MFFILVWISATPGTVASHMSAIVHVTTVASHMVVIVSTAISSGTSVIGNDLASLKLIVEPFLIQLGPEITELSLEGLHLFEIGIRAIQQGVEFS